MQDDIKGELRLTSGNVEGSIPDVPRPVLEALFKTITSANETLEVRRRLPAVVDIDSVEQLTLRLSQWTEQYQPISRNLRVIVFSKSMDETRATSRSEYKDVESFRRHAPNIIDPTVSVTVNFSFLAKNEELGKLYNCELDCELVGSTRRSLYRISNDFLLGAKDYLSDKQGYTAKINVKYTDILVAKSLMNVVDDWYKGLHTVEFKKFSGLQRFFLNSHEYEIAGWAQWLLRYFPLICGLLFTSGAVKLLALGTSWPDGAQDLLIVFSLSVLTLSVFLYFSLSRLFDDETRNDEWVVLSLITKGDEKRRERLKGVAERNQKSRDFWGKTVAAGFVVSALASVFVLIFS